MATTFNPKKDDIILILNQSETDALAKMIGSLTTDQCIKLGLSKEEDRMLYDLYEALYDWDSYD